MTALVFSASGTANMEKWFATNNAPASQPAVPAADSSANGNSTATSFQSLLGQLTGYVNETPAQRMQTSILAQLGITPQQLQNMSPQEREKVEAKVKELMKTEMQAQQQQAQQVQQVQAQIQQQVQAQTQQQASQSTTHSPSRHGVPMINLFA